MNPEDRELLTRSLRLAEENNMMLKGIKRTIFWSQVWGVAKTAIIVIPFIIGYFYLQPYLGSFGTSINQFKDLVR